MSAEHLSLHITEYSAESRQRSHMHDALHLSMVLRGRVLESACGVAESLGPLNIVSKDPGLVHANEWGAHGAVLVSLSIKDRGLGDLSDRRPTHPWTRSRDVRIAASFLRLVRRSRGPYMEVPCDDADVADLVAALTARPSTDARGVAPAWLRDATEAMTHRWRPGITVREIAGKAGVHPVYLARCVRRWFGVTVGEVLRAERLRRAAAAIGASEQTVSRVAHEFGFADEPHFCRALKNAAGVSPGDLRRTLSAAQSLARLVDPTALS